MRQNASYQRIKKFPANITSCLIPGELLDNYESSPYRSHRRRRYEEEEDDSAREGTMGEVFGRVKLFWKYPTFGFQHVFTSAGHTGRLKEVKHLLDILHHLNAGGGSFDAFIRAQLEKLPAYLETVNLTAPNGKEWAGNILEKTLALSASFPLPSSWKT